MSWLGDVQRPEVEAERKEIMQGRNVHGRVRLHYYYYIMADAEADTGEKSVTRERPGIAAGGTDFSTGRS
jgi:hypothetical protein